MSNSQLKYLKTFESFLLEALSEDKEMAKDISQKLIAALSKTLNDDEEEALEQIMRIESKEMLDMVSDEVKKSTKMDLPTYLNDEMSDVDVEYKNIFTWIKELDPEMAKKYKENKFLQKAGKVIDYIQDFNWENFLVDLYGLGFKLIHKLVNIIVKTYQKFKHWREENPKTWRLIVICLLILIFVVIFSTQAVAAKTGTPPPTGMIDSCIGVVDSLRRGKETNASEVGSLTKAMAYLIELKKGNKIEIDSDAQEHVRVAMKLVKDAMANASGKDLGVDKTNIEMMMKFAERGSKMVTNWDKFSTAIGSKETLRVWSTP
jgi:hypothetical protein